MAASIKIYELSASQAGTDKTASTIRFKLADNATVDTSNPLTIPSAGSYQTKSYSKHVRLYCATAPSVSISNPRLYTDGSNGMGTGITINASNAGAAFNANSTVTITASNVFSFTSASPKSLKVVHTADVTATGYCYDIIKMQCLVASNAVSGYSNSESITFSYDEI